MNIRARTATPALAAFLALFYGCTQDFEQFTPFDIAGSSSASSSDASSSSSGVGGASSSSSSSSASSSSSSSSASSSSSSGQGGAGVGGGSGVGGAGGFGGLGGMGGMGGSPLENCLDGIDNDGDNAPDCMDTDCGTFECTAPAPAGWEGYFRINTTTYPNAAPSLCPDGAAPATFFDTPSAGDCTACSCGAWANAACAPPTLVCYENSSTCQGNVLLDLTGLTADGTCLVNPPVAGNVQRSCILSALASVMNPGSCPASGGTVVFPDPWVNQDDVCGQQIDGGSGCAGGGVCVPVGAGDYNGPVCIRKMGKDACPAGYPNLTEVAMGETDTRACNACQCTVNGVTCAGGDYTIFDLDACQGGTMTINAMTCVNVTGELDNGTGSISGSTPAPANGTCTESGGEPTGTVTPQGVVTFCCK